MSNQNQFDAYKRVLAGGTVEINPNDPLPGYYRTRLFKGAPLVPVAIWEDEDGINVLADGKPVLPEKVWPSCFRNPIPYAYYDAVANRGEKWPDIDATVHEATNREGIGGNNPPTDPAELLKEQIESAAAGIKSYATIADDETLARAQSLRSRLLELAKDADGKRETEKAPHLIAAKVVDGKWMPLVKMAQDAANAIRTAMSVFETAKLRKQREAEAKAAAEAAAAAPTVPLQTGSAVFEPVTPPPPARTPAPIKGAYGRAASSRPVKVITEVTDWPALFAVFQTNEDVRALLRKIATKVVNDGGAVAGVTIEERARVA